MSSRQRYPASGTVVFTPLPSLSVVLSFSTIIFCCECWCGFCAHPDGVHPASCCAVTCRGKPRAAGRQTSHVEAILISTRSFGMPADEYRPACSVGRPSEFATSGKGALLCQRATNRDPHRCADGNRTKWWEKRRTSRRKRMTSRMRRRRAKTGHR